MARRTDYEPEICSGCGAADDEHPIVGVTRDEEDGKMAAFPVCKECHVNPAHRKTVLKMHFFPRAQAPIAVDAAERNVLVEGNDRVIRNARPQAPRRNRPER